MLTRFSFIVVVVLLPMFAFAKNQGQYSIIKKYDSETSINYDGLPYNPKLWYVSARADLSLLSWKNEYTVIDSNITGKDKYDWKPVYGADIAIGRKLNYLWRADLEFGYMGNYSESETEFYENTSKIEHTSFDLTVFYATLNAYYTFDSGIYFGLGAGAAFVKTALDYSLAPGNVFKNNISPIGAGMLGLSYRLRDNLDLDLRYRFAALSGDTLYMPDYGFKMKIGLITDNSISVGVRYAF